MKESKGKGSNSDWQQQLNRSQRTHGPQAAAPATCSMKHVPTIGIGKQSLMKSYTLLVVCWQILYHGGNVLLE